MKNSQLLKKMFIIFFFSVSLVGFKYSTEDTSSINSLQSEISSTSSSTVDSEEITENSTQASENSYTVESETLPFSSYEKKLENQQPNAEEVHVGESFFVTIIDENYEMLDEPDGKKIQDNNENFQKTFSAQKIISSSGEKYFLLTTPTKLLGYISIMSVEKVSSDAGKFFEENDKYASVVLDDAELYTIDFKESVSTKSLKNRTFKIEGYYNHFNKKKYYLLKDETNQFIGIVESSTVEVTQTKAGKKHSINDYYSIIRNDQKIWMNLDFSEIGTTASIAKKTFNVKEWYYHFNGKKYYTLYDDKETFKGFVEEISIRKANNIGGIGQATTQYITVIQSNGTIWDDFQFINGKTTKEMYQRTYRVTEYFNHFNGSKYLSVYDNKGNWQGYLNERDGNASSTPGGKWNSTNQYVTITKNSGTIWNDFGFKSGRSTKEMYQRTYRATGYYNHFNGSKYLSVYDNKGNWQGYLNERDGAKANGAQGTGFSMNKSVLVVKSGYSIWNNFSWKEKLRTNSLINKTYQIKWYYKHMNGSTYYSLYESNGKWLGYVNSGAVRERRGAAHYLGTSRQRIINELTAHQNDRFYLGTTYRGLNSSNPEPYMVPYGAPNQYGPGMNCTGFVACVMRRSGGNLQRISGITQGWGSYANAYNWRDALMRNTEYYTFNSVDALLKSGKAQKGDIIYFDPVWSDINYDCHIGIFWGNSSKENRIWHQVLAGNMQSHIFSGTRFSKIFLFPQD